LFGARHGREHRDCECRRRTCLRPSLQIYPGLRERCPGTCDGSYSGDGSGDIFIAFSTANPGAIGSKGIHHIRMLPNGDLDPIFLATVQATEEAVINAMVAAETMTGINNRKVIALPHDRLREVLKKYNRLVK